MVAQIFLEYGSDLLSEQVGTQGTGHWTDPNKPRPRFTGSLSCISHTAVPAGDKVPSSQQIQILQKTINKMNGKLACVRTPQWAGAENKSMQLWKWWAAVCQSASALLPSSSSPQIRSHNPRIFLHSLFSFHCKEVRVCAEKFSILNVYFSPVVVRS